MSRASHHHEAQWPAHEPKPRHDRSRAGEEFLWGVSTSAFQHEGGVNGEGEPKNNWAWAERENKVDPAGNAADFWTRAEEDFQRCRELGINAFRLSLSWERIQPTTELTPDGSPSREGAPSFDVVALGRYAEILAACRREGLEPVVTLHHFTHPAWLGLDAWLDPSTIDHYLQFVEKTVGYLLEVLPSKYGAAPPRWYLTINEPNLLSASSYFNGTFPIGEKTAKSPAQAIICISHLLEAHVRAYRLIHRLYREQRRSGDSAPQVSFNNYSSDLYWHDQAWMDLIFAPSRGIAREHLFYHLWKQTWMLDDAFLKARLPIRPMLRFCCGEVLKKLHHLVAYACFQEPAWNRLLDVLYDPSEGTHPPLDYIAFDYYDPFIAHALRWPRWNDLFHKHRHRPMPDLPPFNERFLDSITNKWWDWRLLPEGLSFFVRILERFNLPLMIAENGMAHRSDPRGHYGRRDNLMRSEFLRRHIAVVKELKSEGWPLIGYFYWSLVDNYEWGSYAPRFGLYSRKREPVDFQGDNAAETYAREIATTKTAWGHP
jgi:beta-glucosidase/6-phospho-beta-glucosidase/beta-galactosidase